VVNIDNNYFHSVHHIDNERYRYSLSVHQISDINVNRYVYYNELCHEFFIDTPLWYIYYMWLISKHSCAYVDAPTSYSMTMISHSKNIIFTQWQIPTITLNLKTITHSYLHKQHYESSDAWPIYLVNHIGFTHSHVRTHQSKQYFPLCMYGTISITCIRSYTTTQLKGALAFLKSVY